MKTQKEYLKAYAHCPACNSDQIEGYSIDIDGNECSQDITCLSCWSTWTDVYTLTGYANLQSEGVKL